MMPHTNRQKYSPADIAPTNMTGKTMRYTIYPMTNSATSTDPDIGDLQQINAQWRDPWSAFDRSTTDYEFGKAV
tara:strand:- start:8280 stop:8501 length:222 start_codon:yes stop_codon:yes gene_type:complete